MNKKSLMNLIRAAALAALAAIPGMCQCSYSVSINSNSPIPAAGGVVQVYVRTLPGCSWQISHNSAFLSYYGGRTGTGSGFAYLYAAADRSAARSATIYVQRSYSYQCGFGTRSTQWCTGYTNANSTTAVQY
jgi:hypothetical protein